MLILGQVTIGILTNQPRARVADACAGDPARVIVRRV